MLINYTYQMKNIESKINKGAIDKQKAEDLLFWDESECEDKNEQEIVFIQQRVILQAAHKKFVDKNDIPILKKSGMKTRMEELIPHYKTNYFSENYPFDDILKLREHFIKSIIETNENLIKANHLALKHFLCFKYFICLLMDKIENLKKEKAQKLILSWAMIKTQIASNYDEIFSFEDLEKEENKIMTNLMNEIRKMFLEFKKIEDKDFLEWVNEKTEEKRMTKFNKWLDDIKLKELKKQIKETWFDEGEEKTFADKLREGNN